MGGVCALCQCGNCAAIDKTERRNMMELPDDVRKADFQHWAKAPHWTPHEAVALSLGAEPEDIQDEYSDRKSRLLPRGYYNDWESEFFKRRDLLDRCQQEEVLPVNRKTQHCLRCRMH